LRMMGTACALVAMVAPTMENYWLLQIIANRMCLDSNRQMVEK